MTLPTALIALSILIAWEIATPMTEASLNWVTVFLIFGCPTITVIGIFVREEWERLAPSFRRVIERQEQHKGQD